MDAEGRRTYRGVVISGDRLDTVPLCASLVALALLLIIFAEVTPRVICGCIVEIV